MSAALEAFVADVRAAAEGPAPPSAELLRLFAEGVAEGDAPVDGAVIVPFRRHRRRAVPLIGSLGLAAKIALGAAAAAAAVGGAAAADSLPPPAQHLVAQAVSAVTPFHLPDHGSHPGTKASPKAGSPAPGRPSSTVETPAPTTTTTVANGAGNGNGSGQGDTNGQDHGNANGIGDTKTTGKPSTTVKANPPSSAGPTRPTRPTSPTSPTQPPRPGTTGKSAKNG